MEVFTIVFFTAIIVLLTIVLCFTIRNNYTANVSKNITFITVVFISSCLLLGFDFYKNLGFIFISILLHIILTNAFFKELDIPDEFYLFGVFWMIPFVILIEIIIFFAEPVKYTFLFYSIFLLVFLAVELYFQLKNEIRNRIKITIYIVVLSVEFILSFNIFLNFTKLFSDLHTYILGFNFLSTVCFSFIYLSQVSDFLSLKQDAKQLTNQNINKKTLQSDSKYAKSSIDTGTVDGLVEKIENLDIAFFLNAALRQEDLVRHLNTSKHHFSQVLNSKFNCNFQQFVNSRRIEFAEENLKNTDDDMETIALKSGFNSKVTFYRAFKNKHDISPGDYRKEHR